MVDMDKKLNFGLPKVGEVVEAKLDFQREYVDAKVLEVDSNRMRVLVDMGTHPDGVDYGHRWLDWIS